MIDFALFILFFSEYTYLFIYLSVCYKMIKHYSWFDDTLQQFKSLEMDGSLM